MWRCFWQKLISTRFLTICSTHVEMFPRPSRSARSGRNLLHACGDVSPWYASFEKLVSSAPRMWRCFTFFVIHGLMVPYLLHACGDVSSNPVVAAETSPICSTHVEMFPISIDETLTARNLLHACGDVSMLTIYTKAKTTSAPRMWRCFLFPRLVSM